MRDFDIQAMGNTIRTWFRDQSKKSLESEFIVDGDARRRRTADEVEALLAQYDPWLRGVEPTGAALLALDKYVLGKAAAALEKDFDDAPYVRATLHAALADAYMEIRSPEGAERPRRAELALFRATEGDDEPHTAQCLYNLALALNARGKYQEAESSVREALAIRRRLHGNEHEQIANSLNILALALAGQGKYDAAEPLYREALDRYRKLLSDDNLQVAAILNGLGVTLRRKGNLSEAE